MMAGRPHKLGVTGGRTRCDRVRRTDRAFTLTEMLVALFVIVIVIGVVSSVFSITAKTAALSSAAADAETLVRSLASELRADLEQCDPAESILVIQGRTVPAALTEEQRQAGQYWRVMTGDPDAVGGAYDTRFDSSDRNINGIEPRDQFSDPRADILMFFSKRPTISKVPPTCSDNAPGLNDFQRSLIHGAEATPIQVVYGHAAIDTAVRNGNTWQFSGNEEYIRHIEKLGGNGLSQLPANRWQLVRRAALLDAEDAQNGWSPQNGFYPADDRFLSGLVRYYYEDEQDPTTFAADSIEFNLADYLREFGGASSLFPNVPMAFRAPYQVTPVTGSTETIPDLGGLSWSPGGDLVNANDYVHDILYAGGSTRQYHHIATVIEEPPPDLRSNLGLRMVPSCPWFKVEFLMPEDARNAPDSIMSEARWDTPYWVEVPDDQIYVFVPDTDENRELVRSQVTGLLPNPDAPLPNSRLRYFTQAVPPLNAGLPVNYNGPDTAANRRVRMWPYALRITVMVADPRGRMETPITHSFVHWFD